MATYRVLREETVVQTVEYFVEAESEHGVNDAIEEGLSSGVTVECEYLEDRVLLVERVTEETV